MSEHFDVIVVGSGFGGSVITYRTAKAGLDVCLLERGQGYPPNTAPPSFARTPRKMRCNFWDPSRGMYGLFNIWSFEHLSAIMSSGLGGGSLIYANVLLRKDARCFAGWPISRSDLDPHYDAVEYMLQPVSYPNVTPYGETPKTLALEKAGRALQEEYGSCVRILRPPIAVTFAPTAASRPRPGQVIQEPVNLHGQPRYTCRLCGECNIGCNYGSKNTLDFTYLTEAWRTDRADIRTLCEVRSFYPRDGGGYAVEYVKHDPKSRDQGGSRTLPVRTITCDRLVLSAGTFGSTFLLLKNRANLATKFPLISRLPIGTRFCANGDYLGLLFRSHKMENGISVPAVLSPGFGPVITAALRLCDKAEGGDDPLVYIEDGGYPDFFNWVFEAVRLPAAAGRLLNFLVRFVKTATGIDRRPNIGGDVSRLVGTADLTATSLPLLGIGLDEPDGRMSIGKDGLLDVDWRLAGSLPCANRIHRVMGQIARVLRATYLDRTSWNISESVTVHPLGGCPMGRGPGDGVVDTCGEVFGCPGLYVADGSVMPGPIGTNPSMTIAAVADRFADCLIAKARLRATATAQTTSAPALVL